MPKSNQISSDQALNGQIRSKQAVVTVRFYADGPSGPVQSGESGNALGLVSSVLSVAASAASGAVAIEGNTASDALKDVGYFLTGVTTATDIADAYNRGDIQGGLMASLNGLLTAYSIASQINNNNSAQAAPSSGTMLAPTSNITLPILDENGDPLGEGDQGDPGERAADTAKRVIAALDAADRTSANVQLRMVANGPPGLAIQERSPITASLVDAIQRLNTDPDGANFHAYGFMDYLGKAGTLGTDPFSALVMHAVPGGNNDGILIPSGTVSKVQVPVLGYLGTVQTIVDPSGANLTLGALFGQPR